MASRNGFSLRRTRFRTHGMVIDVGRRGPRLVIDVVGYVVDDVVGDVVLRNDGFGNRDRPGSARGERRPVAGSVPSRCVWLP